MLTKCRKCAICAVAVGTACTLCSEVAAAIVETESQGSLYIAADQPHNHDELKPWEPTDKILIRPGTTAGTTFQPVWGEIPVSVASTVRLSWWMSQLEAAPAPG